MGQSVELIITKSKQLFPKTKYNDGDFAIVSCVINETINKIYDLNTVCRRSSFPWAAAQV